MVSPRSRRNRGRRDDAGSSRTPVRVTRNLLLGPLPSSNGQFASAVLALFPGEPSLAPFVELYSEYRIENLTARIVPTASTSATGALFLGYALAPLSGAPVNLESVSALANFRSISASHSASVFSRLDVRARSRSWFECVVNPSATQLLDRDVVQAWLVVGSSGLQSGLSGGNVHISATYAFRAALPPPPSTVAPIASLNLFQPESAADENPHNNDR